MSRYLTKGFDPSDLLPCPFCGGEAEWRDGSSTKPYIRCKGCGMRTGGSYACDKLKAAWNRRRTTTNCGEITCRKDISEGGWWCKYSCCGYEYLSPFESEGISENYCPNCGAKVAGD